MADKTTGEKAASWEKTVEWAFVRNYLPNAEFAAPIDGDHEISDAFLAQRGQWFLIEFKHTEKEFSSEKHKYPSMSRKRTFNVLRKNYETTADKIKELNKNTDSVKWFNAVWDYEQKLIGKGDSEQFEKDSILKQANKATIELYETYKNISLESNKKLEPHFFVFSRNDKFDALFAVPYWINWFEVQKNERGWPAFDPALIGVYGQNFEAFSDYVLKLAMARGYNVKKLEHEGQSDFKAVVFGRVAGFSRDRNIVMPLDIFLKSHETLKASYELSHAVENQRKGTQVDFPTGDTLRP